MSEGPLVQGLNVPRMKNLTATGPVPPGMGELNYIQTILSGAIGQTLYITSSPTFVGLTLSGLTASALVGTSALKALQSYSVGDNLSLVGTTLDTIQGIKTTNTPQFTRLGIGVAAGATTDILINSANILKLGLFSPDVANEGSVGFRMGKAAATNTSMDFVFKLGATVSRFSAHFYGDNFGDCLTLWKGGNVGIGGGDVAPTNKFEVTGNVLVSGLTASLPVITSATKVLTSVAYATFKASLAIAQADVAGLTTTSTPVFAGINPAGTNQGAIGTVDLQWATGFIKILATDMVGVIDSNASHYMSIGCGSDLTASRTLTITPGDAARTITLSGNPTLADWFDQAVKQASSPTFAGATIGSLAGMIFGTAGVLSAKTIAETLTWLDIGQAWITPSYSAGDFTGNNAMTWTVEAADVVTFAYTIIGKTMVVSFNLSDTVVGGTPSTELRIKIPASKTATKGMTHGGLLLYDNGIWLTGYAFTTASGTNISLKRLDSGVFTAGTVRGYGQITFEIN